jgi:predicted dehydrogenase
MKASIKFDTYVQVNHIYLFHPAYKEIFNLLPLIGSIREIYSIGGNWGPFRDSHSSLWDWMPHDVSMCMKVVGTRPKVISSEIKVLKKNGEIIKSTLGFNQNIRAYITCGNGFKEKKRFFKIVAENGTIIFDDLAKDKLKLIMGKDTEIIPFKYESPLCLSVSSFSRSILKQEHLNSDIKFAVDVAQVIANIERKLRDIN